MRFSFLKLLQIRRRIMRRLPGLSKEVLAIISVGLAIGLVGIFLLLKSGDKAAADNWQVDDDQYRKQITVTNNTSDQTSVYVQLTVDTSDTNRFQADGGDIRFIKANGEILPYYISSGIGSTATVINIYFDTLISGPQDMYMYYGNSTVRDGFNPTNFSTAASSYSMGTPAAEEKSPGPAGFWKFDEGSGTTANDTSYNKNNGTLGGTATVGVGGTANVIRQEINMLDGALTGTHTTAVSNALVQVDTTQYGGTITAYLEVVGTATASSTGSIRLRRNGTTTDDITISTSSLGTSTTRVRSASFSPPDGQTEYFIYVDDAGASKTVTIKSARIIIIQNQAGLTATESQFEIGNQELAKTNTSTAALTNPKYWTYDASHWDPAPTLYAEATYKKTDTGTAIPTYENKGAFTSGTGSLSVPVPSGYQDNDVFLLFVESANQSISTPSGWTQVANSPQSTGTAATAGGVRLAVFYKIVSGAQSDVTVADTGNHTTAIIANFRGVDTTNPIMITAGSVDSSATSSLSWPAVTTTETNALIVNAVGLDKDSSDTNTLTGTFTNSNLANLTERHDQTVSSGVGGGIGFATGEKATTGSTGNTTVTADSATTHAYLTIALTGGTDISNTVTMYLQEDNGSFAGWSNIATIVNASTTSNTPTRSRSTAFTPTDTGRHYRIVSMISDATNSSYDIYNAKIIADQTGSIYALESQYLLLNTADSGSTGRQGYPTYWDSSEWAVVNNVYNYAQDATNAADSSKLQDIDNGNADITDATATGANQQIGGTEFTMPTTGHQLDVNVTNTTGVVTAARIIATVYVDSVSSYEATAPDWRSDQCISDQCLYFDGSNDNVIVPHNATIDFDQNLTDGFTYSFWIKPSSQGENGFGGIFVKGIDTYATLYSVSNTNANLVVSVGLDSSFATTDISNAVTLNKWHHIEIAYTNDADDEITVYIDGVQRAQSTNGSGNPTPDSNQLIIGGFAGSHFNGFIDEFKIYNQERTAAQVKTDYLLKTAPQGAVSSFGQQSNNYLHQDLAAYWPLEDTASPALDLGGAGNVATWVGNSNTAPGKYGWGISLDGTGDYLTVPDNDSFSPNDITLSAWIRLSVLPSTLGRTEMILRKADTHVDTSTYNNYQFYVQSTANTLRFEWYQSDNSSQSINGSTALVTDTWYHVVVTKNGSEGKLYLNGVLDGSNSLTDSTFYSDSTFYIGSNGSGADLDGTIDEVRVYDRGLSDAEVRSLYNWAPGPVGYWKFDETSGTTASDVSGNANNGTLHGGNWFPGKYGQAYQTTNGTPYEYIDFGDPGSTLDFANTQDYTYSIWYKHVTTSDGYIVIVNKGATSNSRKGYDLEVDASTGDINCKYTDGNASGNDKATYSSSPVLNGNWNYITCLMDRDGSEFGTAGLYILVNGVVQGSDTSLSEGDALGSTNTLYVGENDGSYAYSAYYDDFKIYNYARSPGQIIEDMNAGHPIGGSPVGSPAIYYKFDEGYGTSSTSVNDSSVNNLTAGFNGSNPATWSNNCKFNRCLTFDDSHYGVRRSHVSFLNGATKMSVSMWVNPTTLTVNRVLTAQSNINLAKSSTTQNQFVIAEDSTTSSEIRVYIASSATDTSNYCKTTGLALANGTWDHLAVVYDGSQGATNRIKVYKNGKPVTCTVTGTIPTALTTNTAQFYIGASDGPDIDVFNGSIDEYKLYTAALTQEQVYVDANRGKSMVMGSTSTGADGTQPDNSAAREYCIPGDTTSCNPPIAEWKLDAGRGTSTYDTSGNGFTGTLGTGASAPLWTPGKLGSGLNFSRANATRVDISDNDAFSANTTNKLTVETWMKTNDTSNLKNVVTKGAGGGNYEWGIDISSDGKIRATLYQSGGTTYMQTQTSSGYLQANTWYHIAMTADLSAPSLNLYINGSLVNQSTSSSGSYVNGTAAVRLGGRADNNNFFDGILDNVRIYNYVRTPDQIQWDYNRGKPIAWYRFDSCQGTTAYNAALNANGLAAGMNGTITIGATGTNTSAGTCNGSSSEAWKNGATGKINSSLSFDGSDDYVSIADNDGLDFGTNSFSVAMWIKHNTASSQDYILQKWISDAVDGGYGINMQIDGTLRFGIDDDGTNFPEDSVTSTTRYDDNQWHHVVAVKTETSKIELYVDGQLVNTNSGLSASGSLSNNDTLVIGARSSLAQSWTGQIDDVRIYNYPLTPIRVQSIYNNGAVSFK